MPAAFEVNRTKFGRGHNSLRYYVAAGLLLIGLPIVSGQAIGGESGGMSLKYYQLGLAAGGAAACVSRYGFRLRRMFAVLLGVAIGLLAINFCRIIVESAEGRVPLIRGILNILVNCATCAIASRLVTKHEDRIEFCYGVQLYGWIVAASGCLEYLILKLAPALLAPWRTAIWGSINDPTMTVLEAGGSRLVGYDIVRVGGVIGSPENLGVVLALTLPALFLTRQTRAVKAVTLVLYGVIVLVSASRGLAAALLIALGLTLFQRRLRPFFFGFAGCCALMSPLYSRLSGLLGLGLTERFGQSGIDYEWTWRQEIASQLFAAVRSIPGGSFWGLGLGWGAEARYDVQSVTSGVLGGDAVTAYAFGGMIGVALLAALWIALIRMRLSAQDADSRHALNLFLVFAASYSLIAPFLCELIFTTAITSVMIIVNFVILEPLRVTSPVLLFSRTNLAGTTHLQHS